MFLSKYWSIICKAMPSTMYLKWQYWHIYHKKLNIGQPKTYAEKLAFLKVHRRDDRLTALVDKYEVRGYVSKLLGKQYLIPLIGVFNSTDDIPWDDLPKQYVLKCTHDSASVILHVQDKGMVLEQQKMKELLNVHLSRNLYWFSREYPYRFVKPRIICEEFISEDGNPPIDYKFLCFNGEPKIIIVDFDRFMNHKRNFYDVNWNRLDITSDHEQSNIEIPPPLALDEMLSVSSCLSKGFVHVRVDLYCVSGKVFFGELTFFPWGGPIWFEPDCWNYILGSYIKLDN